MEHEPLITGKQSERLDRIVEIETLDAREIGRVTFTARLWAQVSLPYRDPGAVAEWKRTHNKLTLIVQPGIVENADRTISPGYPYGIPPRLLMIWMATEAIRLESRELALGPSLASFMRQLGYSNVGGYGKRKLRNQVQRLTTARLLVTDQRQTFTQTEGFHVATATKLYWTPRDGENEGLYPSTITLSEEFYDSIRSSSIPLDLRAINELRTQGGGALAIDIYTWLAHRMHSLKESKVVAWPLLAQQFGSQYKRPRDFKARFVEQLPNVRRVYPGLKIAATDTGLLISPSPTPVGPRLRKSC